MNMARLDSDQVKAHADTIEVARALGVKFARTGQGGAWKAIHCPNTGSHKDGDKRASAAVSRDGWTCSACGEGGDVFSLYATCTGLDVRCDFRRIIAGVADVAGIVGPNVRSLPAMPRTRPVEAEQGPTLPLVVPDPPPDVEGVMRAFWNALEHHPLSSHSREWFRGRGIPPLVADDYGCRDLAGARIRGVLADLYRVHDGPAVLARAGLWDANKGRLWAPLNAAVEAERSGKASRIRGVLFPIWHPCPLMDVPVAWRFRRTDGGSPKSWSDCGSRLDRPWADLPLGVRWEATYGTSEPWCGYRDPDQPIVIAEGEPDFLTLAHVLEPFARVYGAPGGIWRDQWAPLLRHVSAVVDCTHVDRADAKRKVERRVVAQLEERFGYSSHFYAARILKSKGGDWNDRLQRYGLTDAVLDVIRERVRKVDADLRRYDAPPHVGIEGVRV